MNGSDFSTQNLTNGQGIYFRKGAAGLIAVEGGLESGVAEENAKRDKAMREAGKGTVTAYRTPYERNLGYHERPATKSELHQMYENGKKELASHRAALDEHSKKAQEHADRASSGKGLGRLYHEAMAKHHESQANRVIEASQDTAKWMKQVHDDLKRRFNETIPDHEQTMGSVPTGRFQVSTDRTARLAAASGQPAPTGSGEVGGKEGHPFYGNQHTGGIPGGQ